MHLNETHDVYEQRMTIYLELCENSIIFISFENKLILRFEEKQVLYLFCQLDMLTSD
jgi:hypothetical protein